MTDDLTKMRRSDREQDDAWIKSFLGRAPFGFIATCDGDQPYINCNNFVYDEESHEIYLHSALEGRLRKTAEHSGKVSLMVAELGRLLPAPNAMNFSSEFSSVIVYGTISLIEEKEKGYHSLQLMLDKYFPHLKAGEHYRPTTEEELAMTSVYRIKIEQWSGKAKKESDDFKGAFHYGENPE